MKITKFALDMIYTSNPDVLQESGGILGSSSKGIITDIIQDVAADKTAHPCQYEPNVNYLNKEIIKWHYNNIKFKGLYHIHISPSESLSIEDKEYITKIMKCMPDNINKLYFPVYILPLQRLDVYVATKFKDTIQIVSEELIIVN